MALSNDTKVLLNDNNSYTYLQLFEMSHVQNKKLIGYAVTPAGLIVETELTNPLFINKVPVVEIQLSTNQVVEATRAQVFYLDLSHPVPAMALKVLDRPMVQFGGEIEVVHMGVKSQFKDCYTLTSERYGNYILASGLLVKHN